jgi:hypothetical protein
MFFTCQLPHSKSQAKTKICDPAFAAGVVDEELSSCGQMAFVHRYSDGHQLRPWASRGDMQTCDLPAVASSYDPLRGRVDRRG